MQLALDFEAAHLGEIRRHYQSITPDPTRTLANSGSSLKSLLPVRSQARLLSRSTGGELDWELRHECGS
jgi:hypothetical protein